MFLLLLAAGFAEDAVVVLGSADDRERTDHEHRSEVAVACLGYAPKALFAAARVLSRHQADPGREVAT